MSWMSSETFDRLEKFIQRVGFPVVCACALLGAGWKLSDRFITSHVRFVDAMVVVEQENAQTNKRHAAAAEQTVVLLRDIKDDTSVTAKQLEKLNDYMEEAHP